MRLQLVKDAEILGLTKSFLAQIAAIINTFLLTNDTSASNASSRIRMETSFTPTIVMYSVNKRLFGAI